MTTVCLRGKPDRDVREALLTYETARSALAPYDLTQPFENAIAIETVSLGAAISFLNDLSWYLARTTADVFVREPSISPTEWLSRDLATAVRNGDVEPEETAEYLKVYGEDDGELLEPMYVTRRKGSIPTYDLAAVSNTVVVRVTQDEFGAG